MNLNSAGSSMNLSNTEIAMANNLTVLVREGITNVWQNNSDKLFRTLDQLHIFKGVEYPAPIYMYPIYSSYKWSNETENDIILGDEKMVELYKHYESMSASDLGLIKYSTEKKIKGFEHDLLEGIDYMIEKKNTSREKVDLLFKSLEWCTGTFCKYENKYMYKLTSNGLGLNKEEKLDYEDVLSGLNRVRGKLAKLDITNQLCIELFDKKSLDKKMTLTQAIYPSLRPKIKTSKKGTAKMDTVVYMARNFAEDLRKGIYKTDEEVIEGLKKLEPKYEFRRNNRKKLLRADGSPYEIRIAEELSIIYEIQMDGETVEPDTVKKAFKEAEIPLGGGIK